MRALRHFGFLLCLAFAFAIGQQGLLLHTLGHATEQLQHKGDGKLPKVACDQCALSAPAGGMPVAGMPHVALVDGGVVALPFAQIAAPARRVAAFRSRAPPAIS